MVLLHNNQWLKCIWEAAAAEEDNKAAAVAVAVAVMTKDNRVDTAAVADTAAMTC
jgi:hypothetical protein